MLFISSLDLLHYPPNSSEKKILFSPQPQLMLSWAVFLKYLFDKVTGTTWLFPLINFTKQSASWTIFEICEECALSTDSQKICSLNTYNIYEKLSSSDFETSALIAILRWAVNSTNLPIILWEKRYQKQHSFSPKIILDQAEIFSQGTDSSVSTFYTT